MSEYLSAIRDALDYTKKINQFLKSDLSFDAKIEYTEQMVDRRQHAFDRFEGMIVDETDGARRLLKSLQSLDVENNKLMQTILDESVAALQEVRLQKINSSKSGRVQKRYLAPANETGFFINNAK